MLCHDLADLKEDAIASESWQMGGSVLTIGKGALISGYHHAYRKGTSDFSTVRSQVTFVQETLTVAPKLLPRQLPR